MCVFQLLGLATGSSRVLKWAQFFGLPILQYMVLIRHCFVPRIMADSRPSLFSLEHETKPWNHLHVCAVVLWTKTVVECMFYVSIERITAIKNGRRQAKRM